jgi:hypothetical protein
MTPPHRPAAPGRDSLSSAAMLTAQGVPYSQLSGSGPFWCSSGRRAGSASVHRMERCWRGGGNGAAASFRAGASGDTCAPGEADGRPAVLVATIAINNDSFGLMPGNGTKGLGHRGMERFLDMLAEQVGWVWVGLGWVVWGWVGW